MSNLQLSLRQLRPPPLQSRFLLLTRWHLQPPSQHSLLPRSPVVLLLCQLQALSMLLQWLLLLVELLRLLQAATVFCFSLQ